jgi:hypothetical protein
MAGRESRGPQNLKQTWQATRIIARTDPDFCRFGLDSGRDSPATNPDKALIDLSAPYYFMRTTGELKWSTHLNKFIDDF